MCFLWKATVKLRLHNSLLKIGLIWVGVPDRLMNLE